MTTDQTMARVRAPMVRRWGKILAAVVLIAGSLVAGNVVNAEKAEALSGSDFNPAYIISDALFYDSNAMSQSQIQDFLNANVGNCTNGNCLKQLRTDTSSRGGDLMCGAYAGAAGETTAAIIFKVQQACGISARVLLVTLQKEQGLITNPGPSASTLSRAMGYACPDSANGGCDPTYSGLYNQLYRAAWQFKRYGNPPGTDNFFTWFPVGSPAPVAYNPDTTHCKSPVITIQNKATAALYYYTPYQPNPEALANLGGVGNDCSSYGNRNFWVYYNNWFGSPTGNNPLSPVGNFELGSATLNTATLRGWVFDPETAAPINVHLYINGTYETGTWGGQFLANVPRLDVANAYPSYGANHGFEIKFPVQAGSFQACLYGINVGKGDNVLLGCKNIATPTGPPIGNIDSTSLSPTREITVNGWALDPDSTAPISIHVYVNNVWRAAFTADKPRTDIARVYPGYGANHGYSATLSVPVGTNDVCVYGINVGGGANNQLSCTTVSSASGPPFGSVDSASVSGMTATFSGWALDPDTPDSIAVHAYVDGVWGGAYSANSTRNDVARVYDGYGAAHGYTIPLQLSGGVHSVCLYGINVKAGYNSTIGCKTVSMPTGSPIGNVESNVVTGGTATISGWALDPDSTSSIDVHVYVNGQWVAAHKSDVVRNDVASAYPGYGAQHGFSFPVAVPVGTSQVCVYGINVGPGGNSLVRCVAVSR